MQAPLLQPTQRWWDDEGSEPPVVDEPSAPPTAVARIDLTAEPRESDSSADAVPFLDEVADPDPDDGPARVSASRVPWRALAVVGVCVGLAVAGVCLFAFALACDLTTDWPFEFLALLYVLSGQWALTGGQWLMCLAAVVLALLAVAGVWAGVRRGPSGWLAVSSSIMTGR